MDLHALLSDYRLYDQQIEKLHQKHLHRPRSLAVPQDGVALSGLFLHREKVARLLAAAVGSGTYEFQPAGTRYLTVRKKQRLMYVFCLTDLLVHGVLARIITDAMAPYLSSTLHSYIKGRSWATAVRDFARCVREHSQSRPDATSRGLYVLRRDVRDYTNSIPVADSSKLFASLQRILGFRPDQNGLAAKHWAVVQKVVRPDLCADPSRPDVLYTNRRGIPTGSPISTVLFNLYIMPMDHALAAVPGGFYARYCDDFLFAHPDPRVVQQIDREIDAQLAALGLETKKEKNLDFYFNGAGKSSPDWPKARGSSAIPFLGCNISFSGGISLPPAKARRLLRDLRSRARRTCKARRGADREELGRAVCAAINQALHPTLPLRNRFAAFLRCQATDRHQLRQLDYQIARLVAQVVTGKGSVKAFQHAPYRKMRTDWKLLSLCRARNRKGRRSPQREAGRL
jgi:hypothetical protein